MLRFAGPLAFALVACSNAPVAVEADAAPPMDAVASDTWETTPPSDAGPCGPKEAKAGESAWLRDDCLWKKLDALATCEVHEAKLPSTRYPARRLTDCGPGCRVADLALAGAAGAALGIGWTAGSKAFLRIEHSDYVEGASEATTAVDEIWDPVAARTMMAVSWRKIRNDLDPDYSQCSFSQSRARLGPVGVFAWWYDEGYPTKPDGTKIFYAIGRYQDGPTIAALVGALDAGATNPAVPTLDVATTTHWAQSLGGVRVSGDLGALPPHPLVFAGGGVWDLQTDGVDFYWRESVERGRLHRYSPKDGASIVFDRGARDVVLLAIGGGGATWIEATYDGARYSDIALMRAELPAGTPRMVTSLVSVSFEPLLTTDKHAALLECAPTKDVCDLLIVELATGALTRIGQPGTGHYWEVLGAMSDGTLYVGDSPDRPNGHHYAQRVFALDLAERAALAKQWPP